MKLNEILNLNPESLMEAAAVSLAKTRRYISVIFFQLKRLASDDVGTAGVSIVGRRPVFTYNSQFIRLLGAVGPRTLSVILAHEALHVALCHYVKMRRTPHPLLNKALDMQINYLLGTHLEPRVRIFLLCPLCCRARTLKGYIEEFQEITEHVQSTKNLPIRPHTGGHKVEFGVDLRSKCSACKDTGDLAVVAPVGLFHPVGCVDPMNISKILRYLEKNEKPKVAVDILQPLYDKYPENEARFLEEALFKPNPEFSNGDGSADSNEGLDELESMSKNIALKGYGKDTPSILVQMLDELKKAKDIPWYKYITNRACQALETLAEPSRLRRNRRYGFIHPGTKKKQRINIVIGLDTSGSMDRNLLGIMKSNILSLENIADLTCTVVEFDDKVHRSYDIRQMDSTVVGRRGTSLNAPLEWLIATKQPKGTLVFVFTDGIGSLNIAPSNLDKYLIHWMLPKDGHTSCIERWRHKRSYIKKFDFTPI